MDIKCPHCDSYNNIREVVTRCLECNNNLFNQKTEKMNNVFKKGDRVYSIIEGWGTVEEVSAHENIAINFDNGNRKQINTSSRFYKLLSFTEYRLEGFSQQRPFEPEIGKFYWFWDSCHIQEGIVVYGKLKEIKRNITFKYLCHASGLFQFISDKNPLENDSE